MIITLGPSGTYSELAAQSLFPDKQIVLKDSFFEIFANHKENDVMVLPLENSNYGSVTPVWEAIVKKDLFVSKTLKMQIRHSLGAQSQEFDTIYGHPQAIGQCSNFLHKHYHNLQMQAATSTGAAMAQALKNPHTATIGSKEIMISKGLKIISENINDSQNNETVFGVISNQDLSPNEPKTTTLIVIEPQVDKHGLLLRILQTIESEEVNMTRLESRPQGDNLGRYKFFIDLQTSPDNEKFQAIHKELSKEHNIKIIGAY